MMASALLTSGSVVTDSRLGIVLTEKNMSLFCLMTASTDPRQTAMSLPGSIWSSCTYQVSVVGSYPERPSFRSASDAPRTSGERPKNARTAASASWRVLSSPTGTDGPQAASGSPVRSSNRPSHPRPALQ